MLPAALEDELAKTTKFVSDRLRSGRYKFSAYKELLSPKGARKLPRVLSVPTARDRIALRALAEVLGEVFPQTRSDIPHKCVEEVADVIRSGAYSSFVKLDLESFYSSISHKLIESALRKKIRKTQILDVIMKAVQTPTVADRVKGRGRNGVGVPQGLAVSNSLAELVLLDVDATLKTKKDCFYVRYVDDILILCSDLNVDRLNAEATTLFTALGLKVHPKKQGSAKSGNGLISDGFEYLGYHFRSDRISVRQDSVRNIEASVARIITRYKYEKADRPDFAYKKLRQRLDIAVTGCIYDGNPYGWLNYFRQMDDLTLLKELDVMVGKMVRRCDVPVAFRPKSFVRAYWSIRHPHGKDQAYIPNFDKFNHASMRQFLGDHMGEEEAAKIPERSLGRVFRRVMHTVTVDLEKDIGHPS